MTARRLIMAAVLAFSVPTAFAQGSTEANGDDAKATMRILKNPGATEPDEILRKIPPPKAKQPGQAGISAKDLANPGASRQGGDTGSAVDPDLQPAPVDPGPATPDAPGPGSVPDPREPPPVPSPPEPQTPGPPETQPPRSEPANPPGPRGPRPRPPETKPPAQPPAPPGPRPPRPDPRPDPKPDPRPDPPRSDPPGPPRGPPMGPPAGPPRDPPPAPRGPRGRG